ncbi:MAG: sigma-70 family RNA polymerase sigma factor [Clostridiales bacterium]|nr:sigma-70 family RNA polymerase sigma factor [Clostridiales bacterium]
MSEMDIFLIKKCVDGDFKSFEQLIVKYEKNAFAIALRYLGNYDDALDVTQEALIKVYKNIKNFRFESSFTTWLYRIVINTSKDFLKKNNKEKIISIEDHSIDLPDDRERENPVKNAENKELKLIVEEALMALNEENRIVVLLKDIQGFTYDEISDVLQIPIGTVRSRISRGRAMLKNELMKQNPDILNLIG